MDSTYIVWTAVAVVAVRLVAAVVQRRRNWLWVPPATTLVTFPLCWWWASRFTYSPSEMESIGMGEVRTSPMVLCLVVASVVSSLVLLSGKMSRLAPPLVVMALAAAVATIMPLAALLALAAASTFVLEAEKVGPFQPHDDPVASEEDGTEGQEGLDG